MVRQLASAEEEEPAPWLDSFCEDFTRRMCSLLGYEFRQYLPTLALSLLDPTQRLLKNAGASALENARPLTKPELDIFLTPYDLKRLDTYARGQLDYHVIVDLLPLIGRLYFSSRLPVPLSSLQAAILVSLALQHKSVTQLEKELQLPSNQILALFGKAAKKITACLQGIVEQTVSKEVEKEEEEAAKRQTATPRLPGDDQESRRDGKAKPSLNQELEEMAKREERNLSRKQQALLKDPSLQQFAIKGSEKAWESALKTSRAKIPVSLSIPTAMAGGKKKHGRGAVLGSDEPEEANGRKGGAEEPEAPAQPAQAPSKTPPNKPGKGPKKPRLEKEEDN